MIDQSDLHHRIAQKYLELGLEWSWRLLYTPFSTVTANSGVVLLGLNPGGHGGRPEVAVHKGCAYLDECWGTRPGESRLQTQVQAMFELVARSWKPQDGNQLLRQSLTGNLVPFRSPNWSALRHKRACLAFWREHLA
jgi:hypothetical protein